MKPSHSPIPHYKRDYTKLVEDMIHSYPKEEALRLSVGGNFDMFGAIELQLLKQSGLLPHHTLLDIGCGSGRLTSQLTHYLEGHYVGTDVSPLLLEAAKQYAPKNSDFFEVTHIHIPVPDCYADMVCFFSVFTHLHIEEVFVYLKEAWRSLKNGGTLVFSYLELPLHMNVLEPMVTITENQGVQDHLNAFMHNAWLEDFAKRLEFRILKMHGGKDAFISMTPSLAVTHGLPANGFVEFGQSVAIWQKS